MKEAIKRFITGSILGGLFWMVFFYLPPIAFSLMMVGILLTILLTEWKNFFKPNKLWFWFVMPWYPILPFALLIYMNGDYCYRNLIYFLFVVVFAFDGTAYIVGTLIGRHKILPSVSPGKTVEGCVGGVVGAMVMFFLAVQNAKLELSLLFSLAFVFSVCVMAFVGDLFESFLKRRAGIKDSGDLLPGHGGFLDRFDAVMMASFFFFFFRNELAAILCF